MIRKHVNGAGPEGDIRYALLYNACAGFRDIGRDLAGRDQKALPRAQMLCVVVPARVLPYEDAPSAEDIVEEVMVPDGRSEGVSRIAVLPSELVQTKI